MSRPFYLSLVFLLSIFLLGCSPLFTEDAHQAACRELKSEIVFNGATSNDRQAEIQRAQQPLQERSYDLNCR